MRAKKRVSSKLGIKFKSVPSGELLDRLYDLFESVEIHHDCDTEEKLARLYVAKIAALLHYRKALKLSEHRLFSILDGHVVDFLNYKQEFLKKFSKHEGHASFVAMSMVFANMAQECKAMGKVDTDGFTDALTDYMKDKMGDMAPLAGEEDPIPEESESTGVFLSTFRDLLPRAMFLKDEDSIRDLLVRMYGAFSDIEKPPHSMLRKDKVSFYVSTILDAMGLMGLICKHDGMLEGLSKTTLETVELFLKKTSVNEELCIFWGCMFFYYEVGVLRGVFESDGRDVFHEVVLKFVGGIQDARVRIRMMNQNKLKIVAPLGFRCLLLGDSMATKELVVNRFKVRLREGEFIGVEENS